LETAGYCRPPVRRRLCSLDSVRHNVKLKPGRDEWT
jgi:hypothetical protein